MLKMLRLEVPLILLIVFLFYYIGSRQNKEGFLNGNLPLTELENPLIINNECNWKQTDDCKGDIPLINASCNKVPNFPNGLEPVPTELNQSEYFNQPFHRLADKEGRFTFNIPELKYDGIYSKSVRNNECCWSSNFLGSSRSSNFLGSSRSSNFLGQSKNPPNTYGADNFLHVSKNLNGKTIIEPPECAKYPPGYPPCTYLNSPIHLSDIDRDCGNGLKKCGVTYRIE